MSSKILEPEMPSKRTMPKLQTLFGDGWAVVVGLPKNFNLSQALRSAKEIRLATAFSHDTGWALLREDIAASKGKVCLLTGLECNQTEPSVLRDWLKLQFHRPNEVFAKLASNPPFFHPKVFIVRSPSKQFAVVGSGNLSRGGLKTNCECGVFIEDDSTVIALCDWFDEQFEAAKALSAKKIEAYEPEYRKAKNQIKALAKHQSETQKKIDEIGEASFAKWNRALKLAEGYFRNKDFNAKYIERRKSVKLMLRHLNAPKFDFDRNDWFMFYQRTVLGALDSRYRDNVFSAKGRLRKALLELMSNPEGAIGDVLGKKGKLRIKGFGVNTVSKILAAAYPSDWPVYNARVAAALADFGYMAPRGAGRDGQYIAFRNTMMKFMAACRERGLKRVDAISLDAFFYERSKELGF